MPDRPHLIIFNPDQWRADAVGHLGNAAAVTPNVDAACDAETGDFVSFRNAFCQNPVCTPSRCSFMTGWYPHTRGHRTMFHMLHAERGEPNLLSDLKSAGYHVVWAGKNDLLPGQDGFAHAVDKKIEAEGTNVPHHHSGAMEPLRGDPGGDNWYSFQLGRSVEPPEGEEFRDGDWALVRGVCAYLRTYDGDAPLCVYLPISYPHPPYTVEEPYFSMIDREAVAHWPRAQAADVTGPEPKLLGMLRNGQRLRGWTEDRWTELRATYLGMVARVDAQFGLLMDTLKETGRYDDSAVFCFSDHGDFTGDGGLVEKTQNTFEDRLTNVPLFVKPPKRVEVKPGVRDALVELVDFTATAYLLAGVEPGHDHFGRSLLPVLDGETQTHRDAVFCEGGRLPHEWHCAEQNQDPGNTWNWYHPRMLAQRDPVAHGKAAMVRTHTHKYVRRNEEPDQLFDLEADPLEQHNRIDDPALAGVLADLRLRMLTWYQETCDVVPRELDQRSF